MSALYSSRKEDLIRVFEDTRAWYESDPVLKERVKASIEGTVLYPAGAAPAAGAPRFSKSTEVIVSRSRTLQAAMQNLAEHPDARVAVHNFASATNPGGGVERGSSAQEEAICRCSTLYPALCTPALRRDFYDFHRARHDTRYTDACIYTPGVTILKTDTALPERLGPADWKQVDALTCAAPNLREKPYNAMNPGSGAPVRVSDAELLQLHLTRGRQILRVAAAHGADILVLGAFGCGAFRNPPAVVARAYRQLMDEFDHYFRTIEFAVYCTDRDTANFAAFDRAMV